jgi:hypothetical protein
LTSRERRGTASAHHQTWNQNRHASLRIVNDILLRMNAILSSRLCPTHAKLGGYVHSQEQS